MHIVIVGNGISGITAARFIRKQSDHRITVVSKETDYFFSRTALMYIYMGHMRFKDTQPYEPWFWEKNRINLVRGEIGQIDFKAKRLHFTEASFPESVHNKAPKELDFDKLILALGSASNKFGWPGQDLKRVQGLYSYQDLEKMENGSVGMRRAVIVGGGLIGIEMAEMFHSRHIPVTLLVREEKYWNIVLPNEESEMVSQHILDHGIDLRLKTELKEIIGDDQGQAIAVMTNHDERIDCQLVGLTAGVHPNVKWLADSGLEIQKGILVNNQLQTNIDDVYAIGDCAQLREPKEGRRPIEAVWYTGRMMGETAAYNVCGHALTYDPGIWFNSAKFMDIEYQVYGHIPTKPVQGMDSFFWQHPQENKSIRIAYDANTEIVKGFNLMGIRFRHEVCEKWLSEETRLNEVVGHLALASFDPEFYKPYHQDFLAAYNQARGKSIEMQSTRQHNSVFAFLKK